MTAFAYRDTLHQEISVNTSQEEVMESLQSDIISFMPDSADEDGEMIKDFKGQAELEFLYKKQFVDSEGNIYPYSDEDTVTIYGSCSHDFVSGTSKEHNTYSDGNCEVSVYHAQRCGICGYIVREEEIQVINYAVCPHG